MISVKGWHGDLSKDKSKKMDEIATVIVPRSEWAFDGTIEEFVSKWQLPFLAWPFIDNPSSSPKARDESPEVVRKNSAEAPPKLWFVWITDYYTFHAR